MLEFIKQIGCTLIISDCIGCSPNTLRDNEDSRKIERMIKWSVHTEDWEDAVSRLSEVKEEECRVMKVVDKMNPLNFKSVNKSVKAHRSKEILELSEKVKCSSMRNKVEEDEEKWQKNNPSWLTMKQPPLEPAAKEERKMPAAKEERKMLESEESRKMPAANESRKMLESEEDESEEDNSYDDDWSGK